MTYINDFSPGDWVICIEDGGNNTTFTRNGKTAYKGNVIQISEVKTGGRYTVDSNDTLLSSEGHALWHRYFRKLTRKELIERKLIPDIINQYEIF